MSEEARPRASGRQLGAAARSILKAVVAALRKPVLRRTWPPAWQLIAAALLGAVFSLAYTGPLLPEVALVVPAALLFLMARSSPGGAAVMGALFGAAVSGAGLPWLAAVTGLALVAAILFCSASFAGLGAMVSWVTRRARLPVAAVAPPVWVALEFLRARALTGFPWLLLGHALSDRIALIQTADLGGVYAVTFVAALWNSGVADLARQFEAGDVKRWGRGWASAAVAAGVLVLSLGYGAWRLWSIDTRPGPTLVLMQGNIYTPRAAKDEESRKSVDDEIWRTLGKLSRKGVLGDGEGDEGGGDLLVWSESMLPGYYNEPGDYDAILWSGRLEVLLKRLDVPLLTGSNATGPHPGVPREGEPERRLDYNAAYFVDTKGEIFGRYDKIHLVPFGEYIPLDGWPVLSGLTPYAADDPGYAHGDPAQPLMEWNDLSFGVLICYEDIFAELGRRAAGKGADVLVNLSSEAWFAGTSEIPQHFRIARFRAVETRLPLVRCCNVGVSAMIDPAGRAVAVLEGSESPEGACGFLRAALPLADPPRTAPYVFLGDAFAWACAAATVALVAFAFRSSHRRGREGKSPNAENAENGDDGTGRTAVS
ncbi:MAG: apolipoprotein N-acyltransferase [Planctomycetota bacterium]